MNKMMMQGLVGQTLSLELHLRVPKLSTIVDTRIFYHSYWKNFRIPIFSSGFLKFFSGLFI